MNRQDFTLVGETLTACASGALWWASQRVLCVSDLHFGKSGRIARRGGTMLPPYETRDTLARLDAEIGALNPAAVICLGDSFDDLAAAEALAEEDRLWIARLQAGRRWYWVEGNHDPGPVDLGGEHRAGVTIGALTFRHIARAGAAGEISGHYHPKARLVVRGRMISRPCFLADANRLILPAFGTYTGGLSWTDPAFSGLFSAPARAFLTGPGITCLPAPVAA